MPAPPLQDGRPTLSTTQRRQQLEECRFVDVRNLAYIEYKRTDGTPLMRYEDTLDDRDKTKAAVLAFEISQGWLIPDGTEGQVQVPVTTQPTAAQGTQQMATTPFSPSPNGAPMQVPQQQPGQPPPMFAVPPGQMPPQQMPQQMQMPQMMPPQQQFAPQQTFAPQQVPQMMAPPVATPQQVVAAAAPPQQEAPTQAPTGRKRRGSAVAAPPAAPPQQPAPAQQFAPVPTQQFAPQAPQQFAPQGFQPQPTQQAPQAQPQVGVDLTPVIQRVDALGKMVETLGKENAELRHTNLQVLTCLHHLYLSNQGLAAKAEGKNTLPEFQKYLDQFIPH